MPTRMLARSLAAVRSRLCWVITSLLLMGQHIACAVWIGSDPLAESGEGVISTAIVVVIMAFLAVGLWFAFKTIMGNATATVSNQVAQLGN
jgi:hypothetical protein